MATHQYKWDGTDDITSVFQYSHQLGPRDTSQTTVHLLSLTLNEVQNLIRLQSSYHPSMNWTGDEILPSHEQQEELQTFQTELIQKIDSFLENISSSSSNQQNWFVKTNRHSCKDSPLDHPTEKDLLIYSHELDQYPIPPQRNLDEIDFGSAFLAMCRARLVSTAIQNGNDVLSLLLRSKRIYDDFTLQVRLCPSPWDCYLAFTPFDEHMARFPLHEFRCYISNRQLRCVMQYSYLMTCPIPSADIPHAIQAIADYLHDQFLPSLSSEILDLAVDLQCIPRDIDTNISMTTQQPLFEIKFIETNPLGPGTVWGHLHWETDQSWLLFPPGHGRNTSLLPPRGQITDTQGGERTVLWNSCTLPSKKSHREESDGCVDDGDCICVVMYTSRHPVGMVWGGLAHIPPDYMLVIWEKWKLEEVQQEKSGEKEQKSLCVIG